MQIVPHILLYFKISSIRLLALQCSKSLPIHDSAKSTHYFPKVRLQRSSNHHITRKIQHFSDEGTNQKYRSEFTNKHALSSEKFNFSFCAGGLAISQTPSPVGEVPRLYI